MACTDHFRSGERDGARVRRALLSLGASLCLGLTLAWPAVAPAATDPARVFADPQIAQLARVIADGRPAQLRALRPTPAQLAAQGEAGVTLLQWAMVRGELQMVQVLLDLGANPAQRGLYDTTALHLAAGTKRNTGLYLDMLRAMLKAGASPDLRGGRIEEPVLNAAVMARNHLALALLLAHRANPNLANRQQATPLHVAAEINDYESMLMLLKAGADPTLRDSLGATPMRYFAISPRDEQVLTREARAGRRAVEAWVAGRR